IADDFVLLCFWRCDWSRTVKPSERYKAFGLLSREQQIGRVSSAGVTAVDPVSRTPATAGSRAWTATDPRTWTVSGTYSTALAWPCRGFSAFAVGVANRGRWRRSLRTRSGKRHWKRWVLSRWSIERDYRRSGYRLRQRAMRRRSWILLTSSTAATVFVSVGLVSTGSWRRDRTGSRRRLGFHHCY